MNDLNSVTLSGNFTRDSVLKTTTSGSSVLEFGFANNQSRKVNDKWEPVVSFYNAVMFGKRADSLAQYLKKGQRIVLSGQLKQERWEKDGQKNSMVKITVDNILLIPSRSGTKNESDTDAPPPADVSGPQPDDIDDIPM